MSGEIQRNVIGQPQPEDAPVHRNKVVPAHTRWKAIPINIFAYTLIGLVVFLGSCQASQAMGWWSTSGKVSITGEPVKATGADPAEIKGFMTIKEVITAYNITWEEFSKQFNIPIDTPLDSPLNTLEKISPDFSVTKLRAWLTERQK